MKLTKHALGLVGLLGGVGGATNAWLCYANLPVPAGYGSFEWHIIPAGAMHGASLAMIAVGATRLLWDRSVLIRWLGLPVVGWVSGWLSYIPIGLSVGTERHWFNVLFWPFVNHPQVGESLLGLWEYFGFVGAVYYALLNLWRRLTERRLPLHLVMGSLSGCLGSLWCWVSFKPWYFSFLHGAIWGSLVGFGVWKSQRLQSPS